MLVGGARPVGVVDHHQLAETSPQLPCGHFDRVGQALVEHSVDRLLGEMTQGVVEHPHPGQVEVAGREYLEDSTQPTGERHRPG